MRRFCPDCEWSGQMSEVIRDGLGGEKCPDCGAWIRKGG